jgi:hypothetical protein
VAQRWSTSERETASGAIESRQWIGIAHEVVTDDEAGARELGRRYLGEVGRFTHGLVRPRWAPSGVVLVLAGHVPLLRFGPPEVAAGAERVECRFPIRGGLLAARPGGSLVIAQRAADRRELELLVAGYFPRLGGSTRRRSLRRALYGGVQARAHRAISKRFLERVAGGDRA